MPAAYVRPIKMSFAMIERRDVWSGCSRQTRYRISSTAPQSSSNARTLAARSSAVTGVTPDHPASASTAETRARSTGGALAETRARAVDNRPPTCQQRECIGIEDVTPYAAKKSQRSLVYSM